MQEQKYHFYSKNYKDNTIYNARVDLKAHPDGKIEVL